MRKWERQPAWIYNEHAGGSGTTCSDLHLDPDIELTNIIPKSAQTEDISKENKYCLSAIFFFKLRLQVEDIETFVAGHLSLMCLYHSRILIPPRISE